VRAVLTHEDVPGTQGTASRFRTAGVAFDVVRYWGEAVALVAADTRSRRVAPAAKVHVDYQVLVR